MNCKIKIAAIVLAAAAVIGTVVVKATGAGDTAEGQKPWSVRMVESEMKRNPTGAYLDFMNGTLKWNYTPGLELYSFLDVYDRYGDERIWNYVKQYADTITNENGEIYKYDKLKFNLDHVCPGRMYFRLYEKTGEKRYRKTLDILRDQLRDQPRTTDGGFWHKAIYPWQMWLDGLYMGSPFYAQYASMFEKGEQKQASYEDVAHEFIIVAKHTYDPVSKLYRHAWDESREMFWADPETGQSQHVWGRALGWYVMGMVEVLDYLPANTKGRDEMIEILNHIYRELPRYADPETGMWYQVLEQPEREGNYQESTGSAMFVYGMLKAVRRGYLDKSYEQTAIDNYHKLIKTFIREDADGTISITDCCAVAGLGGKDNRDGSFEYYMSEPIRDNDPKGVGPFIWASLEYEALMNVEYSPKTAMNPVPAFPGAEGGGMYATGGRGGKVIYVTSLEDDGSEGTLRYAIEQKGPRTVLFAVSGNISLRKPLYIRNGDLTIAGQSAPGDGICIRDEHVYLSADNVIIRYMRFRLGDRKMNEDDAIGGTRCRNVIIDHCSMSWSTDECGSFFANHNFTMQWCILSEALNSSAHAKGNHGYGGIWGGRNATFHHNLLAHNNSRNPRLDHTGLYHGLRYHYRGAVDIVNNVIYNWGNMPTYGGEEGQWNIVNNYYKAGPASRRPTEMFMEISVSPTTSHYPGKYYISGNHLHGAPEISEDNWMGLKYKGDWTRADIEMKQPFAITSGSLYIQTAEEAFEQVLAHAGASLHRDSADSRIVEETRNGIFTFTGSRTGLSGIIDSQEDVGGWPSLKALQPALDTDGDGIPDSWEWANGLDPADESDAQIYSIDKYYTNLEVYLNSLVK